MRKSFTVMVLLSASLISVFGQGNTSQKAPNAADESAVRDLVRKCSEAWSKGSGEAFAAQFAGDSDFVGGNGVYYRGRRQNAEGHQKIFDTFFKGTRLWLQVKSVRFLRPDVALIQTLSNVLKPGGSDASPVPAYIQSWTVSKHGNEWLVDAFQNTPIQPQGGQASKP